MNIGFQYLISERIVGVFIEYFEEHKVLLLLYNNFYENIAQKRLPFSVQYYYFMSDAQLYEVM